LIIRKWPRRPSSVIAGARSDAVKIERELLLCNPLICRVSSAVEQRFCKPLVGSSILSVGTIFPRRPPAEPTWTPRVLIFMRVREENRNLVLLATVTLVCAMLALIAAAFEPVASTAQTASKETALPDQTSVRVVGVPFVPNTKPSDHQ
jgi:hypothetical protein